MALVVTDRRPGHIAVNVRSSQGSQTGERSALGFQGDLTDAETSQVDMGARNYLPSLGRFTTQDPMAPDPMQPLTGNPYIYGGDDPVSTWDPTGMRPEACHGPCDEEGRRANQRGMRVYNEQVQEDANEEAEEREVDGWVIGIAPEITSQIVVKAPLDARRDGECDIWEQGAAYLGWATGEVVAGGGAVAFKFPHPWAKVGGGITILRGQAASQFFEYWAVDRGCDAFD